MERSSVLPVVRGGGVVWLAVAAVLVALWVGSLNPWLTSAASWAAVAAGWVIVKRIKGTIHSSDAWGALAALALLAAFAWACSEAFVQLRPRLFNPFGPMLEPLIEGRGWIVAVALGLLVAAIGGAWLLSSAISCAAAGAGFRVHAIVARAFRHLKRSRAAGSFAAAAGGMTVAAAMIGAHAETPWRIVAGLAAAYAQIYWFALAERRKPESGHAASGNVREARAVRRTRRVVLGSLIALHAIFVTFYVSLFGAFYGWTWKIPALYVLIWFGGAVWALIAWLFALSRIVYAIVMILLGLACALLLGTIVGSYDWDALV
ncbi:hypothetical protein [Cohnella sp.]|uniref:hypothetical protein n=1 Tax=Cohnella sp. TaxID=1883426 RepID=UPI0035681B85